MTQQNVDPGEAAAALPPDDADETELNVGRRAARLRVMQAAVWAMLIVACLGGTLVGLVNLFVHRSRPPAPPSVQGPIDGTYRVDRYRGDATVGSSGPAQNGEIVETQWWALQSACPSPSCVAVGTRLDDATHTKVAPRTHDEQKLPSFRLVNGQWVSDPAGPVSHDCTAGTPGHDIWRVSLRLAQMADGTLKGHESDSVESNECGRGGTVIEEPVVATRIGDLPAGLPPMKSQ